MNNFSHRRFLSWPLAILIASFCWLSIAPAFADGNQVPVPWFISKNGDNSDGKSWATAWNEMDQVQWNLINPQRGDSLTIDGGSVRMVYGTPMRVQLSYTPYPFYIKVSTEAGHNGQAVIDGNGQSANGVEMVTGSPTLTGNHQNGLVVTGWGLDGVLIAQGLHTNVEYVELSRNKRSGLHITGGFNLITRKCIIHDNGTNVIVDPPSLVMSAIDKCWIYNSSYSINTDGVRMGNGTAVPYLMVQNCVIGPGLREGFRFAGASQFGGMLSNCLMINATRSNIATVKGLMLNKVTSFMTRGNPSDEVHACLAIKSGQTDPPGTDHINNSIFYGGAVRVDPSIPFNNQNNTQFRTTGNTTFLSSSMVDPMFVTNVRAFDNQVPIRALIRADFALQPNSPATGTGSDITSVAQLLGMF